MMPIFRHDGEWEMFRVEVDIGPYHGQEVYWTDAGNNGIFIVSIPENLRKKRNSDSYSVNDKQPFYDFTACGECWQRTGIFATTVRTRAERLCELLAKHNPNHTFRVVKHRCSQKREELMTIRHAAVKKKAK